jgi:hypothetical protein
MAASARLPCGDIRFGETPASAAFRASGSARASCQAARSCPSSSWAGQVDRLDCPAAAEICKHWLRSVDRVHPESPRPWPPRRGREHHHSARAYRHYDEPGAALLRALKIPSAEPPPPPACVSAPDPESPPRDDQWLRGRCRWRASCALVLLRQQRGPRVPWRSGPPGSRVSLRSDPVVWHARPVRAGAAHDGGKRAAPTGRAPQRASRAFLRTLGASLSVGVPTLSQ